MAKIFYELRQNKNNKSRIFGKWFAHSKAVEIMYEHPQAGSAYQWAR